MGKKFTTVKNDIDFEIDDDKFFVKKVIPAAAMFEFSNVQSRITEAQQDSNATIGDVMLDVFSNILEEESFETFNARFFGTAKNPIDLPTFIEVVEYILEEVTGKEDSQSSTSSTDG